MHVSRFKLTLFKGAVCISEAYACAEALGPLLYTRPFTRSILGLLYSDSIYLKKESHESDTISMIYKNIQPPINFHFQMLAVSFFSLIIQQYILKYCCHSWHEHAQMHTTRSACAQTKGHNEPINSMSNPFFSIQMWNNNLFPLKVSLSYINSL